MPARRRRVLLLAFKLLVVALTLWGIHRTVLAAVDTLAQEWARGTWRLEPAWLAASGVLYLLGMLPCGLFWHRVLWAVGQRPGVGQTLRAYYIGHLGKYVPGKAMVVVLRTGLIPRSQGGPAAVAVSVFYETLTMMAVGAVLGAVVMATVPLTDPRHRATWIVGSLALALAAGLPTVPPVFRRLAGWIGVGRTDPAAAQRLERLGFPALAAGWLTVAAGWFLTGLSLWATLRAMGRADLDAVVVLPHCTAAIGLATVAGFVSLIPAGVLVREGALTELLVLLLGVDAATALVCAILARLVGLLSELLVSGILYLAGRPAAGTPAEGAA